MVPRGPAAADDDSADDADDDGGGDDDDTDRCPPVDVLEDEDADDADA